MTVGERLDNVIVKARPVARSYGFAIAVALVGGVVLLMPVRARYGGSAGDLQEFFGNARCGPAVTAALGLGADRADEIVTIYGYVNVAGPPPDSPQQRADEACVAPARPRVTLGIAVLGVAASLAIRARRRRFAEPPLAADVLLAMLSLGAAAAFALWLLLFSDFDALAALGLLLCPFLVGVWSGRVASHRRLLVPVMVSGLVVAAFLAALAWSDWVACTPAGSPGAACETGSAHLRAVVAAAEGVVITMLWAGGARIGRRQRRTGA